MIDPCSESTTAGPDWNSLYRVGGAAALLAGIIFRRNLGVEIVLFSPVSPPATPRDWLLLLQTHRLLGLAYLGIFDLLNAFLVGLMLLALYTTLQHAYPGLARIAASLGFLGVAVSLGSNTALSMRSLSDLYAASSSEAGRALLLPAAQSLLALNRFSSPGAYVSSAGYMSLLLMAVTGLIFSILILRSQRFGRWAAITGLIANSLDLMYCLAFPFSPATVHEQLAVLFIPAAGFFLMAWHILVGVRLINLAGSLRRRESLDLYASF